VDGLRVVFFGFNVNRPPVNDVRVRQAINFAFDRKPVIDNILENNVLPANSYVAPGVIGYKDLSQYWAYDPRKAEELMRQAGYTRGSDGFWAKDGQRLTLKHYSPRGRYPKDAEISEAFQAAMRQFGIQIDLQILEWGTLLNKYSRTGLDAELGTLGLTNDILDGLYILGVLFACESMPPNGFNFLGFCNPAVDELTARGRANPDESQRA
jgi:ABC-type transport system substrate-binding protein